MAYGLTDELADLVRIDLDEFSKSVSLVFSNITTFSQNRVERFFIRVEALGSNAVGLVPVSLGVSPICQNQLEVEPAEIFDPLLEKSEAQISFILEDLSDFVEYSWKQNFSEGSNKLSIKIFLNKT